MKSAVETLNPTRVKLTVEVPFDELKPSLDAAYKSIASQVNIPGFRKGKVPPRIIDQRIGKGAVLEEAVNDALPKFYAQAVEESDVRPLGQPTVDVTDVPDPTAGGDLKFTAEVDVRPQIDLPELEGIVVTVDDIEVSDEDVDTRVESLRERFGTLTTVERAVGENDFVSIDITASIDGEEIDAANNVSYQLGSGTMLEGMDDALAGLQAGETTTFVSKLAGGDRAGQDATITLTVQAVKERQLPDLDDDFAQLASEFDTLAELRDDLREKTAESKKFEQGLQARERLLDHLSESVEVAVPDGVVTEEVNRHLENEGRLEDDEHRAEVEEETRKGVRMQLLLDAIAEKVQVQVGQNDLLQYLVSSAQQYGMDPNEFIRMVDQSGQIPAMVGEVARRKALAAVLEKAVVNDASGNVVDLQALFAQEDEGDDGIQLISPEDAQAEAGAEEAAPAAAPSAADPTAITVSDIGGFEPAEEPKS
ncbi:trigger factor [Kineosporia sp. A_224]|uniref:trigger factor n=1 Tax=Kineosporia sp. A_224 TaxID=1962180 RepID=UPI000B4BC6B9|nr:trigger factor [Kineosporia sp. A_224]